MSKYTADDIRRMRDDDVWQDSRVHEALSAYAAL